ncbi:hypothetical protein [Nocardia rhamnosiphila]
MTTTETGQDRATQVDQQAHRLALAACRDKKEMIVYACEQMGQPKTKEVQTWLESYGVTTNRSATSKVINAWKRERGMTVTDTGDLPALTAAMLDELDAVTEAVAPKPRTATHQATPETDPGDADPTTVAHTHTALAPDTGVGNSVTVPESNVGNAPSVGNTVADTSHTEGDTITEALPTPEATPAPSGNALPTPDTTPLPTPEATPASVGDGGNALPTHTATDTDDVDDTEVSPETTVAVANGDSNVAVGNGDPEKSEAEPPPWWGAGAFYLVALMSMLVSLDTSWLFFEEQLNVDNVWIRGGMFAVLELALIACGIGMAANVRKKHSPGSSQLTAWILCGFSGYMAITWAGPVEGLARVALGPILGMVMLHHALGIEKRAHAGQSGALSRLGRELRERLLSRLGLADDDRDAAQRTRDRAARRVAALVHDKGVLFRDARVARAARIANISTDPAQRETMLAELATRRGLASLATLEQKAPWE